MISQIYCGPVPESWYTHKTFDEFMLHLHDHVIDDELDNEQLSADALHITDELSIWHLEPYGVTLKYQRSQRGIGNNVRITLGRPTPTAADELDTAGIEALVKTILDGMRMPQDPTKI